MIMLRLCCSGKNLSLPQFREHRPEQWLCDPDRGCAGVEPGRALLILYSVEVGNQRLPVAAGETKRNSLARNYQYWQAGPMWPLSEAQRRIFLGSCAGMLTSTSVFWCDAGDVAKHFGLWLRHS